ncbi:MAG: Sec-independent protein translocase protein TatB [Desulfosudaceae bacterium]
MFGIGMPELILILVVALVVIGPRKLPEMARSLGKALGEFKQATGEMTRAVNLDDNLKDIKQSFQEAKEAVNVDITDVPRNEETSSRPAAGAEEKPAGEAPPAGDNQDAAEITTPTGESGDTSEPGRQDRS